MVKTGKDRKTTAERNETGVERSRLRCGERPRVFISVMDLDMMRLRLYSIEIGNQRPLATRELLRRSAARRGVEQKT